MRGLTLVCFAVKQEADPFRQLAASCSNVSILLTGMGRRNAENALRPWLQGILRAGSAGQLSNANTDSPKPPGAAPPAPLALVLTCGFAGGLRPDLAMGTVLFDADPEARLEPLLLAAGAKPARFHCTERVAATAAEKHLLRETTGADAVEMESGIVRDLCRRQGIPSATVRVILDRAEEDLALDFNRVMTSDWRLDRRRLALALARSPGKVPALLRLQKQTRLAASKLAAVLAQIVEIPQPR
jgi:adenosylhomocysteine nucleosidase